LDCYPVSLSVPDKGLLAAKVLYLPEGCAAAIAANYAGFT